MLCCSTSIAINKTLSLLSSKEITQAGIYLPEVNNRSTRKSCEICLKLTIKMPETRQWRHSGIFIVNFKHISQLFLVLLLLTSGR